MQRSRHLSPLFPPKKQETPLSTKDRSPPKQEHAQPAEPAQNSDPFSHQADPSNPKNQQQLVRCATPWLSPAPAENRWIKTYRINRPSHQDANIFFETSTTR